MSEYADILRQLGWRFLFALPFFFAGAGGRLLKNADGSGMLGGFAMGLLSTSCILTGAIIMARPFARLFAEPWGSLFFPSEHFDKPQPMYGIPGARRKEGKYEEAIAVFEKIAGADPQELRAYVSMIDIAIVNLKDEARAEIFLQNGLKALSRREDRETLINAFQNSSSRFVSDRDGVPERALISTDRMLRSRPQK
jgi:tetratricopeptide (TPR) repeat protein